MGDRNQDSGLAKFVFIALSISAAILIAFLFGIYAADHKSAPYRLVSLISKNVRLVWEEKETIARVRPVWYLQPARHPGDGVTVNALGDRSDLILLAGFFDDGTELRLIRRDGTPVAKWPVRVSRIFGDLSHLPRPVESDWNVDVHGAIAMPDGSVVFNFEQVGTARIDRCGRLMWKLARVMHHSLERAEGGGFWIPGRRFHRDSSPDYSPFDLPYREDTVVRVSDDGKVLRELSLNDILVRNGLTGLLSLTGNTAVTPMPEFHNDGINREIFHLNDIEELPSALAPAFPMFRAGDLMVSLRNRNLVLVFDPVSLKVKWWHVGSWVRQHDPDFQPDGTITVFNNNRDGTPLGDRFGGSTIVRIDPRTNRHETVYGGKPGQRMFTKIRGKHQFLADGHLLITEHEAGRVFQVDPQGRIVWQYVNRYDEQDAAEFTDALAYRPDYFRVTNWSCPASNG